MQAGQSRLIWGLLLSVVAASIWSGWQPRDAGTWVMEVAPAGIALAVMVLTRARFPLTSLLYLLVWLHALVLLVGGHYTYAEVPAFNWLRDEFGLARNYYDRVGHLMQGFVPAIAIREILLRNTELKPGKLLFFIIVLMCLGISAAYELVEWLAAVLLGQGADAFLGTQGDVWDTQWDMFCALIGAIAAQLSLARLHDRQLAALSAMK